METIIGLLFILLPVIFKLIGKKLETAGHQDAAGKLRKLAETLGNEDDSHQDDDPDDEMDDEVFIPRTVPVPIVTAQPEVKPVAKQVAQSCMQDNVTMSVAKPKPSVAGAKPSVTVRKQVILNEEPKKRKEKIDPRKLVIYSEIMKPKYN